MTYKKTKGYSVRKMSKGGALMKKSKGGAMMKKSKGGSILKKSKGGSLMKKSKGGSMMKKAKRDYDGDGKIESSKDEYFGSRDKAIKSAMSKQNRVKMS